MPPRKAIGPVFVAPRRSASLIERALASRIRLMGCSMPSASRPKANGYQSIHTTLENAAGLPLEVHAAAEKLLALRFRTRGSRMFATEGTSSTVALWHLQCALYREVQCRV